MKRLVLLFVVLLASCVVRERTVVRPVPPPPPPPGPVEMTVDFDPYLSPYGAWIVLPGYGRAWQPAVQTVGADFYPYGSGGHWVYTDAGWVFDSDYPFGWAVFHYGRWSLEPDYGWVWIPGRTWGPAWVSWRIGGPYVGWAPMGPAGDPLFHRHHWLFVETGHFTTHDVHSHAIDEQRFHAAVGITQPVHGAVPIGPPPAYVSPQIRPVPVADLRNSGRVIPPPPPPGRVTATAPLPPPPPPVQAPPPERRDRERLPPPARLEPAPPPHEVPLPPPRISEPRQQPVIIAAPPVPGSTVAPVKPKTPPPPPAAAPPGKTRRPGPPPPPPH